jgi:bacterioferritin
MGTREQKMVETTGIRRADLLAHLNKAYADEWLAYYQYWLGAKVATGLCRDAIAKELAEHAEEELKHADMLAERILQLGGTPILEPKDWYKVTNCGYTAPKNPNVCVLLDQNIKGEQCAISIYHGLLKYTKDKDPVTYNLILKILEEEVEHEEDLENFKKDIKTVCEDIQCTCSSPSKKKTR